MLVEAAGLVEVGKEVVSQVERVQCQSDLCSLWHWCESDLCSHWLWCQKKGSSICWVM